MNTDIMQIILHGGIEADVIPSADITVDVDVDREDLNRSQRNAVNAIVSGNLPLVIVHGPPGTGKTNTLVPAIRALLKTGQRIHVTGPTNQAVCELARRYLKFYGPDDALLVGNETRLVLDGGLRDILLSADDYTDVDPRSIHRMMVARVNQCNVLFSTVNSGGKKVIRDANGFDVVFIDEATQLVEAETAILYASHVKKLVLAGDHKQLPATVISRKSSAMGYATSLFERLIERSYPSHLLNVQYRMHPSISEWPSRAFYKSAIINGDNVQSVTYTKQWHEEFPPVRMHDVVDGREEVDGESKSKFNTLECSVVLAIVRRILNIVKPQEHRLSIGIIAPYSAQASRLTDRLSSLELSDGFTVSVRTVDGFQGQECDVSYTYSASQLSLTTWCF
jgi:superfamily I DNA and/or RNA helicase